MWKYFIAWFPMIILAIVNGFFREKVLVEKLNELQAHQMSTISMILLFGIYVWILFKIWPAESSKQALFIGLLWLMLTVIFEFLFGHYVMGHTWDKLLHDYNILEGRVWILILVWITISPYVINQLKP